MEKIKTAIYSEDFVQLVKYVLIGVLGLVVDFGIYTILTHFKMNVEIANIICLPAGSSITFYGILILTLKFMIA